MKRSLTLLLKIVICFVAIGVFVGLIRFPQTEGRAVNLDLMSIYTDPFIIYIYAGSIPFFVGLHQTFKLLNLIDTNKTFSKYTVKTLKNIKIAALCLVGFIVSALVYLRFFVHGEDLAGPTMLGVIISFVTLIIATAAAVFQKLLQNVVNMKSENKLTV